jgi:hypothetical protein
LELFLKNNVYPIFLHFVGVAIYNKNLSIMIPNVARVEMMTPCPFIQYPTTNWKLNKTRNKKAS